MQHKKSKQLYHVALEFRHGLTRTVTVKASDRKAAEKRAMKFHPAALRVKNDAS